jgi:hypothetical protein
MISYIVYLPGLPGKPSGLGSPAKIMNSVKLTFGNSIITYVILGNRVHCHLKQFLGTEI